ncbi:MAG: ADP-ribosylglycohydrolase family protein, partial [Chloroflexota bacterium]|nr:ADP-ribosylglycohydrolase family protein [Chloroflexota bacterium]
TTLSPGGAHEFSWRIPDMGGAPIAEIGIELRAQQRADGSVYLDELTWDGTPEVVLRRPEGGGTMWRRAWVDGVDQYGHWWPEAYRLVQNRGTGLLIQGTREWADYRVSAAITPHLVDACGLGARVQGMRRYYGLLLRQGGTIQLVKALDGERVLAQAGYAWEFGETHTLALEVSGTRLRGWANQRLLFDLEDNDRPLNGGAIALICAEGRMATDAVEVRPV